MTTSFTRSSGSPRCSSSGAGNECGGRAAKKGWSAASSLRAILRRNLLVYGLGGVVLPFIGIKAIDVVLVGVGLA
jgi:hypothetical protein